MNDLESFEDLKKDLEKITEEIDRRATQNESAIKNPHKFKENVQHYVTGKLAQIIHNNVRWNGNEKLHQDSDWFTSEEYIKTNGGIEKTVEHYKRLLLGSMGVKGVETFNQIENSPNHFFELADILLGRYVFEDLWGSLRNHGEFLGKRGYGEITFY